MEKNQQSNGAFMARIRMLVALTAAAALAVPSAAAAAVSQVTGGTTQVTISSTVASALTADHLTVTPLAPATVSGSTFTFPIARGHLNKNLRGVIYHRGGLAISNGTLTVRLRRLTLVSDRGGVFLRSLVAGPTTRTCHVHGRHHQRLRCVTRTRLVTKRIATLTDVTVSGTTATANVTLTAAAAKEINVLAGKSIASAGTVLGTATVTPQLS
jgi:hypothetical protein